MVDMVKCCDGVYRWWWSNGDDSGGGQVAIYFLYDIIGK